MPDAIRTVLLAGASGVLGRALDAHLRDRGITTRRLVRRPVRALDERSWDPAHREIDPEVFDGVDAVVNLAGANVGRIPWTRHWRRELVASRLESTATIVEGLAARAERPAVLLNASAIGVYGDRPGERLTEDSAAGEGFFPKLVTAWEAEARTAPSGVRVVTPRTGVVLSPDGGALKPLVLTTRFGLGARFGSGRQHWSWIAESDEIRALAHLLLDSELDGPVNLTAPRAATVEQVSRAVATRMHRPHVFWIPAPLIRLGLGEAGQRLLLDDADVVPQRLAADGFEWQRPELAAAVADAIPR